MTIQLTATQIADLSRLAAACDRVGYYKYLENAGIAYGKLAGEVVQENSIAGRMADAFLVTAAKAQGIVLDDKSMLEISTKLMQADLQMRIMNDKWDLNFAQIQQVHKDVFEKFGLKIEAWTAYAPLEMYGSHYLELGFKSADAAKSAAWDQMLNYGIFGQLNISNNMVSLGLDPVANQWNMGILNTLRKYDVFVFFGIGSSLVPQVNACLSNYSNGTLNINDLMNLDQYGKSAYQTGQITQNNWNGFNDWASKLLVGGTGSNVTITYAPDPIVPIDIGAFYESTAAALDKAASIAGKTGRVFAASTVNGVTVYAAQTAAQLAARDLNKDGQLNGSELAGLSIWQDANENGINEAGELKTLATAGITSIRSTDYGLASAGNGTLMGNSRKQDQKFYKRAA